MDSTSCSFTFKSVISEFGDPEIISFKFLEEQQRIEVVFRRKSYATYDCNPPQPVPDRVWKTVYGVKDGRLVLIETIPGIHTPVQFIPESFDFPKKQEVGEPVVMHSALSTLKKSGR